MTAALRSYGEPLLRRALNFAKRSGPAKERSPLSSSSTLAFAEARLAVAAVSIHHVWGPRRVSSFRGCLPLESFHLA